MIQTIGFKYSETKTLEPIRAHQRKREKELGMYPVKVNQKTYIYPPASISPEAALKRHLEGNALWSKNVIIRESTDEFNY